MKWEYFSPPLQYRYVVRTLLVLYEQRAESLAADYFTEGGDVVEMLLWRGVNPQFGTLLKTLGLVELIEADTKRYDN